MKRHRLIALIGIPAAFVLAFGSIVALAPTIAAKVAPAQFGDSDQRDGAADPTEAPSSSEAPDRNEASDPSEPAGADGADHGYSDPPRVDVDTQQEGQQ